MICNYYILSSLMILNGIIFFPPSEYLYFDAVIKFKEQYSLLYFLLPIGNSIGHLLFFLMVRRAHLSIQSSGIFVKSRRKFWGASFRNLIKFFRKMEDYSHDYFRQYGNKYYSVMFGRLVPCVHTAICVPSALSSITIKRYFALTVLGNFFYSLVCLAILLLTPPGSSYKTNLLNAFYVFALLYVVHMIHYAKIKYKLNIN